MPHISPENQQALRATVGAWEHPEPNHYLLRLTDAKMVLFIMAEDTDGLELAFAEEDSEGERRIYSYFPGADVVNANHELDGHQQIIERTSNLMAHIRALVAQ